MQSEDSTSLDTRGKRFLWEADFYGRGSRIDADSVLWDADEHGFTRIQFYGTRMDADSRGFLFVLVFSYWGWRGS